MDGIKVESDWDLVYLVLRDSVGCLLLNWKVKDLKGAAAEGIRSSLNDVSCSIIWTADGFDTCMSISVLLRETFTPPDFPTHTVRHWNLTKLFNLI